MLILAAGATLAAAAPRRQNKNIERIAWEIAAAYKANDLGRLDAKRLIRGRLRIVISYASLDGEDEQPDTVRRFRSFRAVERWLKSRTGKLDNYNRYVQKFVRCRRGRCEFHDDEGSLHNRLYLDAITYGFGSDGRLFIKEIDLYNGD